VGTSWSDPRRAGGGVETPCRTAGGCGLVGAVAGCLRQLACRTLPGPRRRGGRRGQPGGGRFRRGGSWRRGASCHGRGWCAARGGSGRARRVARWGPCRGTRGGRGRRCGGCGGCRGGARPRPGTGRRASNSPYRCSAPRGRRGARRAAGARGAVHGGAHSRASNSRADAGSARWRGGCDTRDTPRRRVAGARPGCGGGSGRIPRSSRRRWGGAPPSGRDTVCTGARAASSAQAAAPYAGRAV
jgi:hypothetical protein